MGEAGRLLREPGIDTRGHFVLRSPGRRRKTRILAGAVHAQRSNRPAGCGRTSKARSKLPTRLPACDALLVSDYDLWNRDAGNRQPDPARRPLRLTRASPSIAFRIMTAATPNEPEVEEILGYTSERRPQSSGAGRTLLQTETSGPGHHRGKDGMAV
jgi:hypothetical protein